MKRFLLCKQRRKMRMNPDLLPLTANLLRNFWVAQIRIPPPQPRRGVALSLG